MSIFIESCYRPEKPYPDGHLLYWLHVDKTSILETPQSCGGVISFQCAGFGGTIIESVVGDLVREKTKTYSIKLFMVPSALSQLKLLIDKMYRETPHLFAKLD